MLISAFCFVYADDTDNGTDRDGSDYTDNGTARDSSDDELALIENVSLPVVVIHIDETKGTIEAMNSDPDHNTECHGTMDIIVPEEFKGYADTDIMPETIRGIRLDYIRGRGNSTWKLAKKPYKIKLKKPKDGEEPVNVLGMGTNKHWALLANTMDPVLIRNRITYLLGEELGFGYTPMCLPVDVIMKSTSDPSHDVYLGTYYLAETIRTDEDRLDIAGPDEEATSPDKITGDYLVKCGQQMASDSPDLFRTERQVLLANDTPSFDPGDDGYINDAQKEYIRDHIQYVEDAIFSEDFCGEDGVRYNELMDMKSTADYWLVQMFTNNPDAYGTGSTYFYKVSDTFDGSGNKTETGKIYWGPLWDFDASYGENEEDTRGIECYNPWMVAMLYDKDENGFRETVKSEWPAVRDRMLAMTEDGDIIDQYRDELMVSRSQDFDLWKDKIPYYYHKTDDSYDNDQDYEQKIENLKAWIINRAAWMDAYLMDGGVDEAVCRAKYVVDGQTDRVEYYMCGRDINIYIPDTSNGAYEPEKEGYLFLGWEREDGTLVTGPEEADRDKVFTAKFVREDEATQAEEVIFCSDVDWCNIEDEYHENTFAILPKDAQDKSVTWSSSDESIASVNGKGNVKLLAPGTVTITATLKSGAKFSYELTVVEGPQPRLESVEMEPEEMVLKVGEYAKLNVTIQPKLAKLNSLYFLTDDDEIADVDINLGLVTGVKPGTTMIRMEAEGDADRNSRAEPLSVVKYCKVTVVEAKDDDGSGGGNTDGGNGGNGDSGSGGDGGNGDSSSGGRDNNGGSSDPSVDDIDNEGAVTVVDEGGSGSGSGSSSGSSIRTGDDSRIVLWAGAGILSAMLLACLLLRRKYMR